MHFSTSFVVAVAHVVAAVDVVVVLLLWPNVLLIKFTCCTYALWAVPLLLLLLLLWGVKLIYATVAAATDLFISAATATATFTATAATCNRSISLCNAR